MTNGTRNRLAVTVLVLALGSSELAAYQGVAPYAKTLLSSGQSHAVRKAGALVARQLSTLALRSVERVASTAVLRSVELTSRIYRLALSTGGATDPACPLSGSAKSAAADRSCPLSGCTSAAGSAEAATPCESQAVNAVFHARSSCPAGCPASPLCPARSAGGAASGVSLPASRGRVAAPAVSAPSHAGCGWVGMSGGFVIVAP